MFRAFLSENPRGKKKLYMATGTLSGMRLRYMLIIRSFVVIDMNNLRYARETGAFPNKNGMIR